MTTARKLRIRAVENASGARDRGVGNIVYKVGEWYESLVELDKRHSTGIKKHFVLSILFMLFRIVFLIIFQSQLDTTTMDVF